MDFNQLPQVVIDAVRNERSRVQADRDQAMALAAAPFDLKLAEINRFLDAHGSLGGPTGHASSTMLPPAGAAGMVDSDARISAKIKDMARALILPGSYVTTQEIHNSLLAAGVEFPKTGLEPPRRITKILSGTSLYQGDRTRGWSLKGQRPESFSEFEKRAERDAEQPGRQVDPPCGRCRVGDLNLSKEAGQAQQHPIWEVGFPCAHVGP